MGSMLFNTNKERGNAGLSLAIAYFGSNGYSVSVPLNDTQDYDIIVDKNNIIERVQIKFTSFKNKANNYVCSLKSSGGTKGIIYKQVINTNIELLFIVCSDKSLYLIHKKDIKNSSSINLCNKTEKYKVKI